MRHLVAAFVLIALVASTIHADEEIFSGPQVGERLAPFTARGTLGDVAGKDFDLVSNADGKPTFIIFVHELTRPSIGLTRLIMDYAAKRAKDDLVSGVVFLSADPTETENRVKRAAHALPKGVAIGISMDGQEGPGAYGLNRNVALTVLVGKENRVTANFALVQPSVQADAPKIAKGVVEVLGGGKVPTLAELGTRGYNDTANARMNDPKLDSLLRSMIQKTASEEQVKEAIAAIETYVTDKPPAQQRIGDIARRIIDAGKLSNYGTQPAQTQLKVWAKKYPAKETQKKKATRGKRAKQTP
ncbi:MAG: hypothetical protein H8E66_15415 [Planctomycetes bacterium]|nr:hypothetical protein [Planctomycetota bacterium]